MTIRAPRLRGLFLALAALAAAGLVGCGASPYAHYQSAHPGWEPTLPAAPGGVEELVAALHGPDGVTQSRVKLSKLQVLDVGSQPWRVVDAESLRDGAAGDGTYAVIARRECVASKGGEITSLTRIDTYLVRAGEVEAYDHTEFRRNCELNTKFLAARGDDVPLEIALTAHVRSEYGRRSLGMRDMYVRGLGYFQAGRLEEAEAVLRLGERGFPSYEKAAGQPGEPNSGKRLREELAEVKRLRGRLHQALGIELPEP